MVSCSVLHLPGSLAHALTILQMISCSVASLSSWCAARWHYLTCKLISAFPPPKKLQDKAVMEHLCGYEALQTCACMVYDTPTGCCSRRGVNWSFDFSFFECVESFFSLVERESAASRRQNSEGGTLTCSLWGRTTTKDQRSNTVKFCEYEMFLCFDISYLDVSVCISESGWGQC